MRLLLDNHLSPRLVERLADVFSEVQHVGRLGLGSADDAQVWAYARANGCTIVTKDADFNELVVLRGSPPKVVWLRLGNCTTADAETALRAHTEAILDLSEDPATGILIITK